ncbi:hypothetical protein [Lentzea sp. NPDC051838]|uniref:hypothetical protein n=1 Tax=Lentzea sp. NPDC051838 TaxID=3154849 RepID=UPI00341349D7
MRLPRRRTRPPVRYLAEHVVPKGLVVGGTTVGGMAWGLDGTLWLVSDDNFSASQVTQFIALAVR